MRKLTTEEWIEKAKAVHGDEYDYSLVEYTGNRVEIKIICSIHGVFVQQPADHIYRKKGCSRCESKLKTDMFIKRANKAHDNKYNYSLVEYVNAHAKVKIICPVHGVFEQTACEHIRGNNGAGASGCSKCSGTAVPTTEEWIEKAKLIHGCRYDYSLVKYINRESKVKIICPVHGVFEQSPAIHLSGYSCSKCSGTAVPTTEEWIEKAKLIHGCRYDYSLAVYTGKQNKVTIICPVHGEFTQIANNHLSGGGCKKCSVDRTRSTTEEWIKKAIKVHGCTYDYSLVEYRNNKAKIKIICSTHGEFLQTPNKHLNGRGCPKCKRSNGEVKTAMFLNLHKINFTEQKMFKSCIYKEQLKFDFYLPDYNLCIEFDGIQHHKVIDFFGGEPAFIETQKRDFVKTIYCADHDIKLIRIPWLYIDEVFTILESELFITCE